MSSEKYASIVEVQHLARQTLDEFKLFDWKFRLDHGRQRCGICNYARKEISISKHFIQRNSYAEVRNTLLHEIAHALVGPGHAHNAKWRAQAQAIGARPEATSSTANMPEPAWALQCSLCKKIVARRHRRALKLNRVRCGYCNTDQAKLSWIKNYS